MARHPDWHEVEINGRVFPAQWNDEYGDLYMKGRVVTLCAQVCYLPSVGFCHESDVPAGAVTDVYTIEARGHGFDAANKLLEVQLRHLLQADHPLPS